MLSFTSKGTKAAAVGWLFVLLLSVQTDGQTKRRVRTKPKPAAAKPQAATPAVKVTLVDEVSFRKLLVPNGKPLVINFWATWCDPCREEFPDLVKFDNEFKGKIDFLTVSLDDPAEIATTVPKFLASMKAEMPAFLLKTADEAAVITSVSKDWQGGMPFTVIYGTDGSLSYFRQGKVVPETLRNEVNKLLPTAAPAITAAPDGGRQDRPSSRKLSIF
jgi:thiol-disulfide isomerase/thioredoxin